MPDKKLTDSEIKKALERLKNTKDYLKEQYREQVKKCPYAELKPIAKQTYEDNKKAFDIAIKAIEEFNRLQAENEKLAKDWSDITIEKDELFDIAEKQKAEIERLKPLEENLDKLLYMLNAVDIGQGVLEEQKHTIKAEAIKEFAERLRNVFCDSCSTHKRYHLEIEQCRAKENPNRKWCFKMRLIDNLVKEMVGEDNSHNIDKQN